MNSNMNTQHFLAMFGVNRWLFPLFLLLLVIATGGGVVNAHVEDLCFAPFNSSAARNGIYNFYYEASELNCTYNDPRPKCTAAILSDSGTTFGDQSICRGAVHFDAVYFTAVGLGFKRDIAWNLAAFSQAIDFAQFAAYDSCGVSMPIRFWTPPMRGFLRTQTSYGGTNRHLGTPFVGFWKKAPVVNENGFSKNILTQNRKQYNGGSKNGCKAMNFRRSDYYYKKMCAALRLNVKKKKAPNLYEGSLLIHGANWAYNRTNLLCMGGFSVPNRTNPNDIFTGEACPNPNDPPQVMVNANKVLQGPIPLSGGAMEMGMQVIHFDCDPNCTAENYNKTNIITSNFFGAYLKQQALKNGYAVLLDPPGPVPEVVARFGIYLHWLHDRASHWYGCDASGSGIVAVWENARVKQKYRLYHYLETKAFNFVRHGVQHYNEQGIPTRLAPGTFAALQYTYEELLSFRKRFVLTNPDWFDLNYQPLLSEATILGNEKNRGVLYNATMIKSASERYYYLIQAMIQYNLPLIPGAKLKQQC